MGVRVSERGARMPASPIRKLMPLADAARARGIHVYPLNIGQPDLETPEPMRRRLEAAPQIFAYTPSGGTPECVEALRTYYRSIGLDIPASDILVTTGGSEAILFAMNALADPGDDILVPEPFYTNYAAFAAMSSVSINPILTLGVDGFHLPKREVWEAALTPRTRAVLLCNPNNPTGTVYSHEELVDVAVFCRDRGLFLVVDEVYREFVYDGRERPNALALAGFDDLLVVVDSLSKRFSACGIRLGCLITRNREVSDACLHMAQGRLSPPGLAQIVAGGIGDLPPEYYAGVASEFQARRDVLYEGLCDIPGVFLRKPEGAFYFVARLPVEDSEDFARFLLGDFSLDGGTVLVAPAPGFYATPGRGHNEVRIAYVINRQELAASVRILAAALDAYSGGRKLHAAAV
jgi:aspartate aminotransferase